MAKVDPTVEETPMSDLENFRREPRTWLEANCPPEMRRPMTSEEDTFWGGRNTKFASKPQQVWFERMRDKGWTVPHWPKEYGGAAIFLRPVRHGPALVAHPLEPDLLRLRCEFGIAAAPEGIFLRRHRPPHLRRTIGLEPGAGFAAKFFQIGHGSFFHMGCWVDLSRRIAEFNISLMQAMRLTDVAIA